MRLCYLTTVAFVLAACSKDKEDCCVETGEVHTDTDTNATDTEDETGQDTGAPAADLRISPQRFLVDVGARWQIQARVGDVEVLPEFVVGDASIVGIDESGWATGLSVGRTEIEARWEGLLAIAEVEVQDSGVLTVQVVSGNTGEPLENIRVAIGSDPVLTDSDGRAVLEGASSAVNILVYAEQSHTYVPATFMGVEARSVILPLRLRGTDDPGDVEISGAVDLSGTLLSGQDEKTAGLITIGLAAPSFQQGALFFPLEQLFAANRELSIEGIPISAPGNLFIRDYGESWEGSAHVGPAAVWAFGGPVPRAELASGLSGVSEALAFLVPHFDAFTWTWTPDLVAQEGASLDVDVRPEHAFDERIEVVLPVLPDGISAETNALLIALSGNGESGPVLTGMGQGKSSMMMSRIRPEYVDDHPGQVLAIAEQGGFGTGGAQSLALADVVDGVATVASWQSLPTVDGFDRETMSFQVSSDERADLIRLQIRSGSGGRRDVYLSGGSHDGVLPTDGPTMGYGRTDWTLLSVDTVGVGYQALLADGGAQPTHLEESAQSTARTSKEFKAE